MWAALAAEAAPTRAWWEVWIIAMSACLTCAGFLTLIWRLVRPSVDRYVKALVEPMRDQLDEVHSEVKPDQGDSMKDTHDALQVQVRQLGQQVGRVNRNISAVDARGRMVAGMLTQHVRESRDITNALRSQGIEIPQHNQLDDEEGD